MMLPLRACVEASFGVCEKGKGLTLLVFWKNRPLFINYEGVF